MTRPENAPHAPAAATLSQVNAVKALYAGTASEPQQRAALAWIVHHAARLDDLSFRPGPNSALDTAFAEGRRFAGLQIKRLIEMPEDKLKELAAKEAKERNGG